MKWLLIVFIFQSDASGAPGPARIAQRLFDDEQACMKTGQATRESMPPQVHSLATCIPQTAFNGPVAQSRSVPAPKGN